MDNEENSIKSKWSYCPVCGYKIPELNRAVRFCMSCGLDLNYTETRKEFPVNYVPRPMTTYDSYPFYTFGPLIDEKDIIRKRDEKLWSLRATFTITMASYFLMLGAGVLIMLPFVFLSYGNIDALLYSPYFLVLTSLMEFVLIIVPVRYIGRYLKQPTLKNRLALLGFSTDEYEQMGLLKEVFIGIAFAIIGILLVAISSYAIELFVKLVFGVEIIYSSGGIDSFIVSADIIALILVSITMIVCVGFSEEVLFRGFMQKGLVRHLGERMGILVNALIFSFIHIFTVFAYITDGARIFFSIFLTTFVPYFAISLMLSYLFYWRKENLIAVIVAHGLYDAITVLLVFMYFN